MEKKNEPANDMERKENCTKNHREIGYFERVHVIKHAQRLRFPAQRIISQNTERLEVHSIFKRTFQSKWKYFSTQINWP